MGSLTNVFIMRGKDHNKKKPTENDLKKNCALSLAENFRSITHRASLIEIRIYVTDSSELICLVNHTSKSTAKIVIYWYFQSPTLFYTTKELKM